MRNEGSSRGVRWLCSIGALTLLASASPAQSLFLQRPLVIEDMPPAATLRGYSMIYVEPPRPTEFKRHDLVTILVDESTRASSSQTLETEKQYNTRANITSFPDLKALLQRFAVREGLSGTIGWDADMERDFSGDGAYDRSDRLTLRITATVLDVKPNGNLVLEARKQIATDSEIRTMVLTGTCRGSDVTEGNTVLSTQMADLRVGVHHEGDLRDAAKKGLIPRVLDALLAF